MTWTLVLVLAYVVGWTVTLVDTLLLAEPHLVEESRARGLPGVPTRARFYAFLLTALLSLAWPGDVAAALEQAMRRRRRR